ncbi:Endonuclease/exonuclease/phosphatase [Mycena amicta]|nr:Endonuclease/exonuclease/phosphatase [Mycena amicta]
MTAVSLPLTTSGSIGPRSLSLSAAGRRLTPTANPPTIPETAPRFNAPRSGQASQRAPRTTQSEQVRVRQRARNSRFRPKDFESAPEFFRKKRERQQNSNTLIARKTRAHLRLSALNVRGVRAQSGSIRSADHKWHDIHRLVFDEKIGVLVVTETHLSVKQTDEINESHMGKRLKVINSTFPENPAAKGIAVVLNRELTNTQGVRVWYLIKGKAILVQIPWYKKRTVTVLGVYAPTESDADNRDFWNELADIWLHAESDIPVPDVIEGDFNLVEEEMDRLPHRTDDPGATAALKRFLGMLGMMDGWRRANPSEKAYTYTSNHKPPTHSRLDRIYVPESMQKSYRNWSIDDAAGSLCDHRMGGGGDLLYSRGASFIGQGRFAIPLHLVHDKILSEYAVKEGAKLERELAEERTEEKNPQTLFKEFKDNVRTFARARAKVAIGATREKHKKLQAERNTLLNPVENSDDENDQREPTADHNINKTPSPGPTPLSSMQERNRGPPLEGSEIVGTTSGTWSPIHQTTKTLSTQMP